MSCKQIKVILRQFQHTSSQYIFQNFPENTQKFWDFDLEINYYNNDP